jgi:rod shape-determining protein MreC
MWSSKYNPLSFVLRRFSLKSGVVRMRKAVLLAVFSGVLLGLDMCDVKFIARAKHHITSSLMPIKQFISSFKDLPEIVRKYVDLKRENDKLRLKLDELKVRAIIADGIERELVELKKFMNLKHNSSMFNLMEKVLGTDKSVFDSYIITSASHRESRDGAVVISSDGLVGMIHDIVGSVARVRPLTSQKMFVPVKAKNGTHMILAGTGKNELVSVELREAAIPNLKAGDELHTSGEGGIFMEHILVAKVASVDLATGRVIATPVANIDELSYVWIINPITSKQ